MCTHTHTHTHTPEHQIHIHKESDMTEHVYIHTHTHTHTPTPEHQIYIHKETDTTEHVYTHTPPRVPDLHFDPPTVVSGEGFNFGSHTAVGGSHRSKLNHLERASRV